MVLKAYLYSKAQSYNKKTEMRKPLRFFHRRQCTKIWLFGKIAVTLHSQTKNNSKTNTSKNETIKQTVRA